MILYRLPIMILTLSIVYIFIAPEEPFAFKLFFKVLPMIVIIFYAFRLAPEEKKPVHWLIIGGLFFSVVGDATIHWFLVGLIAFFIAHVSYTIGFFTVRKVTKPRIATCIPIGIYAILFSLILLPILRDSGDDWLIIPVVAYIFMISAMLWTAILTGHTPAIIGALLFVISDSVLAWNHFIGEILYAEAFIMLPYYAAQLFIAISLYSIVEKKRRIVW